jgi:hypothetical protein
LLHIMHLFPSDRPPSILFAKKFRIHDSFIATPLQKMRGTLRSLNLSAEALRDELRRVSNPNLEPRCMFEDSIFVMEIPNGCNWSSVNAQGYAVIWLANNIREP